MSALHCHQHILQHRLLCAGWVHQQHDGVRARSKGRDQEQEQPSPHHKLPIKTSSEILGHPYRSTVIYCPIGRRVAPTHVCGSLIKPDWNTSTSACSAPKHSWCPERSQRIARASSPSAMRKRAHEHKVFLCWGGMCCDAVRGAPGMPKPHEEQKGPEAVR